MNLCIRAAIAKHKPLSINIRVLNAYVNKIKRSIELSKVFANAKCRLGLENSTRWVSTFLMLERLKRRNSRYIKQASAVSIYVINSYLKILKPAYLVNI